MFNQDFRAAKDRIAKITDFNIQATHSEIFLTDVITLVDINAALALPIKILDAITVGDLVLASALFAATQAWELQEHRCILDKQERRCPLDKQEKISKDEALRQGATQQQDHRETE